jgi:hypothetical protein
MDVLIIIGLAQDVSSRSGNSLCGIRLVLRGNNRKNGLWSPEKVQRSLVVCSPRSPESLANIDLYVATGFFKNAGLIVAMRVVLPSIVDLKI